MQAELFQSRSLEPSDKKLSPLRIAGKTYQITPIFNAYWRFAAERHVIFHRRLEGIRPVTDDPILLKYKFTNAYRVLDRTSQYLVGEVIQKGDQSPTELFYRIVLFKLFNKIETWELLRAHLGEVRFSEHRFEHLDHILFEALARKHRIYSAAYIMPSGGPNGDKKKHRSHLRLLERMIQENVPERLQASKTMEEGFAILLTYPMIGNFLAYQFVTDLNYSDLTDYSEREFVVPGPGAMDGLKKCFPGMVPSDAPTLIRFMCDHQETLQEALGLRPVTLCGRPLQLIDCQNLFCETDKYSRVAFPEIQGISGRTRIKQSFRASGPLLAPVFPAKWHLDIDKIQD
jgi:alpha-glutamyl/putrescinyl thymine pyrophosphorylase clade 1